MIACTWFVSTRRSTPLTISVPSSRATRRSLSSSRAIAEHGSQRRSSRTFWVSPIAKGPCYDGAMPNIGPMEIVGLLLLALLLFGAKRLPEIGRSLGTGMREFKDSVSGEKKEKETRSELPPPAPAATVAPAEAATTAPAQPERETETVS